MDSFFRFIPREWPPVERQVRTGFPSTGRLRSSAIYSRWKVKTAFNDISRVVVQLYKRILKILKRWNQWNMQMKMIDTSASMNQSERSHLVGDLSAGKFSKMNQSVCAVAAWLATAQSRNFTWPFIGVQSEKKNGWKNGIGSLSSFHILTIFGGNWRSKRSAELFSGQNSVISRRNSHRWCCDCFC